MTIIQSLGFYKGLIQGFVPFENTTDTNNIIKIYQNIGNMPADADDWTIAGSAADELATFNDFDITSPILSQTSGDLDNLNWGRVTFTKGFTPPPVNASATGTAAWYAMYDHPSSPTDWLIGTVGTAGQGHTLTLSTLSLVSGNPVAIINWAIAFGTI